jgi:hypothetical protein
MAPAQVPVPPDDGVAKMIGNLNANLAKATGSGVSNASANNRLTTYNDHRTFNNALSNRSPKPRTHPQRLPKQLPVRCRKCR